MSGTAAVSTVINSKSLEPTLISINDQDKESIFEIDILKTRRRARSCYHSPTNIASYPKMSLSGIKVLQSLVFRLRKPSPSSQKSAASTLRIWAQKPKQNSKITCHF